MAFTQDTINNSLTELLNNPSVRLNLIVENPYTIFDLTSDILGHLEEKLEEIHDHQ